MYYFVPTEIILTEKKLKRKKKYRDSISTKFVLISTIQRWKHLHYIRIFPNREQAFPLLTFKHFIGKIELNLLHYKLLIILFNVQLAGKQIVSNNDGYKIISPGKKYI